MLNEYFPVSDKYMARNLGNFTVLKTLYNTMQAETEQIRLYITLSIDFNVLPSESNGPNFQHSNSKNALHPTIIFFCIKHSNLSYMDMLSPNTKHKK